VLPSGGRVGGGAHVRGGVHGGRRLGDGRTQTLASSAAGEGERDVKRDEVRWAGVCYCSQAWPPTQERREPGRGEGEVCLGRTDSSVRVAVRLDLVDGRRLRSDQARVVLLQDEPF
jgi:hypothetical protein